MLCEINYVEGDLACMLLGELGQHPHAQPSAYFVYITGRPTTLACPVKDDPRNGLTIVNASHHLI